MLAAKARLSLLTPAGGVTPFASGPGGYRSPGGEEPYIGLSPGGCYRNGVVYALRLTAGRGVVAISAGGAVRRFAGLSVPGLIDGITFDRTGRFGHRLLVTSNAGARTAVEAIDCRGVVRTITRRAPRVEGGIAVAPSTFGRFAGDLIAPGETSGNVYAITPGGTSQLVANSGLPYGNDIGVESEGFVPRDPGAAAFLADRLTPGNGHPGDDVVLRILAGELRSAGVRPGDPLVATEGGALTDAISCSPRCLSDPSRRPGAASSARRRAHRLRQALMTAGQPVWNYSPRGKLIVTGATSGRPTSSWIWAWAVSGMPRGLPL